MKYTFQIVGVFRSAPFGGNQLAVRPDAAGIATEGMQKMPHKTMGVIQTKRGSTMTSQAQSAQTIQAALSTEVGTLSDKFTGMARVMAGQYDWKPGQGVRSVGEVFNLIVMENGILAGTLTGATGGERPAPIADPERLREALKTSYANLQQTIARLSDADLKASVKLFGRDMTKEGAIRYLFADQHEHLGQSIAYARSNGVIPPWSK